MLNKITVSCLFWSIQFYDNDNISPNSVFLSFIILIYFYSFLIGLFAFVIELLLLLNCHVICDFITYYFCGKANMLRASHILLPCEINFYYFIIYNILINYYYYCYHY